MRHYETTLLPWMWGIDQTCNLHTVPLLGIMQTMASQDPDHCRRRNDNKNRTRPNRLRFAIRFLDHSVEEVPSWGWKERGHREGLIRWQRLFEGRGSWLKKNYTTTTSLLGALIFDTIFFTYSSYFFPLLPAKLTFWREEMTADGLMMDRRIMFFHLSV